MLFATLGKLRGKPLPINVLATLQGVFMLFFFGLMMYIVFYDSLRFLGDRDYEKKVFSERDYYIESKFSPPEN